MKHYPYPKIPSLQGCIKELHKDLTPLIFDDKGNMIGKKNMIFPIEGIIKLHGSNFGINYDGKNIWYQSRNQLVSLQNDTYGFASFCIKHKEEIRRLCQTALEKAKWLDPDTEVITVYGEFCGNGIQKGVAISEMKKKFFVFSVGNELTADGHKYSMLYHPSLLWDREDWYDDVIDLSEFKKPDEIIQFDFNDPDVDRLERLVTEVEDECPVAKHYGAIGTGEGIVFSFKANGKDYRFKVKGEKHKVVKEKRLVQVEPEVLRSIDEFVEYAVTEARLEQGLGEVCEGDACVKKTGDFLRWVFNDVIEEEGDRIAEFENSKAVNIAISRKAKDWFFKLF